MSQPINQPINIDQLKALIDSLNKAVVGHIVRDYPATLDVAVTLRVAVFASIDLLAAERAALTKACQLFTSGLGNADGYYPSLGGPKTAEAIRLMKDAGVDPVWYPGLR